MLYFNPKDKLVLTRALFHKCPWIQIIWNWDEIRNSAYVQKIKKENVRHLKIRHKEKVKYIFVRLKPRSSIPKSKSLCHCHWLASSTYSEDQYQTAL